MSLVIQATQEGDADTTIGKVAHIRAASPGGPRYDETMTRAQRGSVDNLIYLCGPHHDAVDDQLTKHTVQYLSDAKLKHERKVDRAIKYAVGQVGFTELETVCSALQMGHVDPVEQIEMPLQIVEKMTLNHLQDQSGELIRLGLAKVDEVQSFINWKTEYTPDYGTRLAARFKNLYYESIVNEISGDELYSLICHEAVENSASIANDEVRAAALAVVAYLFSTCEIFDHESFAA